MKQDNVLQPHCEQLRKFCYLPKRCKHSNKIIWMEYGYKCRYTDFPYYWIDEYWITERQYIIGILKE